MQDFLSLQNIVKHYHQKQSPAVNQVTLNIRQGEIFTILGSSGCGKTTTLRMIAGFESPDAGIILLNGQDITHRPAENRNIGVVFQDYGLFPHLSVEQNIEFALWKKQKHQRKNLALTFLEKVDLSSYAKRMPHELSGGQQQRTALARALAGEPQVLLLDEPFSNLDASLRYSLRGEVHRLLKEQKTTCILVTHDQEEALSFSDRIAVMNQGVIEQIGTPEDIYNAPATLFVATFIGKTNLIEGKATGLKAETALGVIPLQKETFGSVQVSLRPEHFCLVPVLNGHAGQGKIILKEFKGAIITYWVEIQTMTIQVDTDFTCNLAVETEVDFHLRQKGIAFSQ